MMSLITRIVILLLFSLPCWGQTFATTCTVGNGCIKDLGAHSVRIVLPVSQDGWSQINYGTTSGVYPYSTSMYCTNSPELVLTGGGGSGAIAYLGNSPNFTVVGILNTPLMLYLGTGYTSSPSVAAFDRCTFMYPISGASWSGGVATITTNTLYDGSNSFVSGQTVTVSGMTPSAYNAANVVITSIGSNQYTYPLASNPGAFSVGGIIADNPGTGMTLTANSPVGGGIPGLTQTATGNYYHTTLATGGGRPINPISHFIIAAIGGLTPNTTYHFQGVQRPNQGNSTGQVVSSDFSFTTAADCGGPCYPAPVANPWNPTTAANHPSFTTGYTTVPVAYNSGAGQCVATSPVGPISYGGIINPSQGSKASWSVGSGDTMQMILGEVGYGAIIDIAQGSTCYIPTGHNYCNSPVYLGYFELCAKAVDPLATSIDDPAHRYIVIRTHTNAATDFPPPGTRTGPQWASKMASFISQQALESAGEFNPEGFSTEDYNGVPTHHYWTENIEFSTSVNGYHSTFIVVGTPENGNPSNQYAPEYIVFDRVFLNAPFRQPAPNGSVVEMSGGIYGGPGGYMAVTNSYLGMFDGSNNNTSLTLGNCSAGPLVLHNNFFSATFENVYMETIGTQNCNYGPAVSASTESPMRSLDDVTITQNDFYLPLYTLQGNPAWDNNPRPAGRNPLESKGGRRWNVTGNVFDGTWSEQTLGEAIAMTPNGGGTGETGSSDWLVASNLIRHTALIGSMAGTRTYQNGGPPDPAVTARGFWSNNFSYALSKGIYQYGGPGASGGYFSSNYCSQEMTFMHNTFPTANGGGYVFSTWAQVGSGGSLCAGWTWMNNIVSLDNSITTGSSFASVDLTCCAAFLPNPLITGTSGGSSNTNSSQVWSSAFSQINGAGVTSALAWGGNIVVPGFSGYGPAWSPMSDSQAAGFHAQDPTGDKLICQVFPGCSGGNPMTLAPYLTAAGVPNRDNGDPTCSPTIQNPCSAGVNVQALEAFLGIASEIIIYAGPAAAQFNYLAPDSTVCSVDVNGTRNTDGGGARQRSVTVTGLSAGTGYPYVINCRYSQNSTNTLNWPFAAWDQSNQTTEGTVVIPASGTRTMLVGAPLISGAASQIVSLTPLGGSAVTATCNTSPCSVASVANGAVSQLVTYYAGSGGTGKVLGTTQAWVQ